MILKEKKTQVILENATHEGDTGSPEVQVAILTARINELTDHLRVHKHDNLTSDKVGRALKILAKAVLRRTRLCAETVPRILSCAPSDNSLRPISAGIHTCL